MSTDYDAIVVGLGAMGSASAYHLAKAGRRVLGLDRFRPPHEFGSSHGLTRIIREAYFENPAYVPLVQRAYELWAELEKASGRKLLTQTGGLMLGPPDGVLVTGARRSAEQHGLRHEVLSASQVHERFPRFQPPKDMVAVWEPRAGVLSPELAVQTHLELAARSGAELRFNEPVLNWEAQADGVRVSTANGVYSAKRLVVSAGAWMSSFLEEPALPLSVERQVLCWFEPLAQSEQFKRLPVYLCETAPERFFYGFPDSGDGIKAAIHHQGETSVPDKVRREVDEQEVAAVRELLRGILPSAAGHLKSARVCLYTNTPDQHFILGRHPRHSQVLIVSPCSGHGFKFSPVIGEIAAALVNDQKPTFDLSLFTPERFGGTATRSDR